jgi:hypothetical protein
MFITKVHHIYYACESLRITLNMVVSVNKVFIILVALKIESSQFLHDLQI